MRKRRLFFAYRFIAASAVALGMHGATADIATSTAGISPRSAGLPTNLPGDAAFSAAVMTTVGGSGSPYGLVTILGDWDGSEDLLADHSVNADRFTPGANDIVRSAISAHSIANGFNETIFYYGDASGRLRIESNDAANDNNDPNQLDSLDTENIDLPTDLDEFGDFLSERRIVITGIAVSPVCDLTAFSNVNGNYTPYFAGKTGEIVYVSYWDSSGGIILGSNGAIVQSGVLAFPVADDSGVDQDPPGVITNNFDVTIGDPFPVLFSQYANPGGIAVDDDGNLYFHQADLIGLTGGNIIKVTSLDNPGVFQDRGLVTNNYLTITTLNPPNGIYGTASGPANQVSEYTNYSGTSPLFGNIASLSCGPGNKLYAAVARSLVSTDLPAVQATAGHFTNGIETGATPSMVITFADHFGKSDICTAPTTGSVPMADGFADAVAGSTSTLAIAGVNNFQVYAMGDGPLLSGGTTTRKGTAASRLPGLRPNTPKLNFQIDYTIYSGVMADEDNKVYLISGGTPAGEGRNPSPVTGEILCLPDQFPTDGIADIVDLRGDVSPIPPAGTLGPNGISSRFDYIYFSAPMDAVTFTPTALSGLSRGTLRYVNRLAPDAISAGITLGQSVRALAPGTSAGPIAFGDLDPSNLVSGGDDSEIPFNGDDASGGFEFTFGDPGNCIRNSFFLNSSGNITFATASGLNDPTVDDLKTGPARIAAAWTDLNGNSRGAEPQSFPVIAMGFAGINHFKIRQINVHQTGLEDCGIGNSFSTSLYDDGTGTDENSGANTEGPTALRALLGLPIRADGSGRFAFEYGHTKALGTAAERIITGYSVGNVGSLDICETNLSEVGRIPGVLIGLGAEGVIYELFEDGSDGLGVVPSLSDFDLRAEGVNTVSATPLGQADLNRERLDFLGESCQTPTDSPPTADLTGAFSGTPVAVCKGIGPAMKCKIAAILQLSNEGLVPSAPASISLYLSSNDTFDGGDVFLRSSKPASLAPNTSKLVKLSAKVPVGVSTSGKYLIAVIDRANLVPECIKTNNTVVFGPMP